METQHVMQASLEQALQINRALDPIIKGLGKIDDARALQDRHTLQQMLIKFLVNKDLEFLCKEILMLDNPLRDHCFVRVIESSGVLPLSAIAGI